MSPSPLARFRGLRSGERVSGMTSVCSAHPLVIEAALLQAAGSGGAALIEATCNQVNQEGGYTGMTPAAFRDLVHGIAGRVGLPHDRIILGGDHLGPNPWKHLPAGQALAKAGEMIAAYAAAGFEKLHLDCSMGCEGEPAALSDTLTAERSAHLAGRAERATDRQPVYVIGTEVPTPGGATEALDHLQPTSPDAVLATYDVHQRAFRTASCEDAWTRVVAMVVQPGVEFGHERVAVYERGRAAALCATLGRLPGFVFEGHSTDYQPETALAQLVEDGFAILKVGPALTFALREALYALDAVGAAMDLGLEPVAAVMERLMLAEPKHWRSHYAGTEAEQRILRHYSYSDRIRYYWPAPEAEAAVATLLGALGRVAIPETLISQYLPMLYGRVMDGALRPEPRRLLIEAVRDVLRRYERASRAMSSGQ